MPDKPISKEFLKCPFCVCTFLTVSDLDAHLQAFKILGKPPNLYDHTIRWKHFRDLDNRYDGE
jgi:hypothetical protein